MSEEFRAIPEVKTAPTICIPAETLKEGLKGSLFATATDEDKHILTGVYFKICQDSLEFAATHDHLLVVLNTFGVDTDCKLTHIISGYTGMMLTVDSEQSTVNSELEFTIPMLTDLISANAKSEIVVNLERDFKVNLRIFVIFGNRFLPFLTTR